MSLVTVIKDYIEIVHKIIETSPAYIVQHTDYTDLTTLYFYLINTIKHFFTDVFSFEFFQKLAAFPIIVPKIADSMISEISVLDGTFHNVFTFLDAPIDKVVSTKNEFIIITCLEKFVIGLLNSLFLWLPTSAATFLCLRRFVMQGMEIGYIAAIGTMTANIFWLICVLFGIRWIVIPWMSLDILRYWLGFMLLIKYFWDNRLPAKEIKSDLSLNIIKTKVGFHSIIAIFSNLFQVNRNLSNPIQQIFLFHFLLALTEQTSIYPFISNFSLSAQSTYLESFPSDNIINFILIHCFYLLGIFIGSFSFINFICWFWEEPAYKVYLWATKNFQKIRVGDMVRITHFIFQTLTITLACASLPYFSIEYFITKPLGFLPNDLIFHQSQTSAFLTHSTSPVLYRSPYYFPRQRFFRYDDWAEYYGKNIPLDTSLYDQGAYRLYPIEDLHYGADYEWTRRRSNHVKIRSRMKRIIWFPRNWATQIWDLAKTWSRRNVAWRNEILSQYQNNWDSKSAPFWEQIVREELSFQKSKSYFQNERNSNSPWAASPNWSQKFLASGEGFWWDWWSKKTLSDNKVWWNWILTKKNQITINNNNLNKDQISFNEKLQTRDMIFANYQKLPTSYQLDYWIPQEKLISLYSEQNQRQKNQLDFEIATLRKFIRKINKRIQINSSITNSFSKHTIFSIKNAELYYKKYLFNHSLNSLVNNRKTSFFLNQKDLLNNQEISLIDSNKTLNSLFHNYNLSVSNQSSFLNQWNATQLMQSPNSIIGIRSKDETSINKIKQNLSILSKTNLFNNQSTSLFLTLPAQYYLHKEKSFSRKLQFYGVRTSRELKPFNNSPIFNFYMKTYFHQYKPTRLYIANTKMKRDLGAGGRNRFKSRQYANKQLKKARILSKTPWIRQWVSQSGFLTRRKRLESWIKYSHYNSNELWAFIMKADIDNFIKRQPNSHFLTNNEERLLHLRRFLLGEHYETLRWYSYMQHYRSMKTKIGGTKSFANRIYNQQFKGTFHKVRHLFALTPSLSGGGILTFDQPLYNEFSNDNQNNLFNKELIHEELLAETDKNLNSFLVKDKETNKLNLNFYFDDLIMRSSQIIKNYISEITPIRQQLIQKFLKDKNYIELTNFLWSGQKAPISFSVENQISKKQKEFLINLKEKPNIIPSSFSIDQQRRFQSILIFMFNKRRSLAKDYKRGSERLWKKWRKKYSIQKQIYKQKTLVAEREFRPSYFHTTNNTFLNIEKTTPDEINTEKNKILSIYQTTNTIEKDALYKSDNNVFENKDLLFSYRQKTDLKKALKDSILIQKYFINQNNKNEYESIKDLDFSNNFEKKLEYYNKKEYKTEKIEKIFDVKKENFLSELFKSDKTAIKELIHKIYEKSSFYNRIKLKYFTLNYWFQDLLNIYQYKWNILNINKDQVMETRKIDTKSQFLNNKNKQEQLFNIWSYLQNRTIRERLDINKKILTITNYNQIDNKFSILRASRHLKRARISQRKRLSQPLQKNKNFFHFETENLQQTNPFKIYQDIDSFKPDLKVKLSKTKDYVFSFDSLKNKNISENIINFIESNKIDLENQNQRNLASIRNSNIFNLFQPFLESFYYLPRFSTLWQSNLISSDMNLKSKIDMGSIYETKQNFTPIGTQKELHRQTFNTKNKLQDNIKRKLLDNHLNRFSERRKWTNQYQTINTEINEKLKKFIEILKQQKNTLFINEKGFDINDINSNFFNSKLGPQIQLNLDNNTPDSFSKDLSLKSAFFSLNLQRSIQSFTTKETDQPTLLSVIIREKNQSKLKLSQLSSLQLNYIFNQFKRPKNKDFAKSLNFTANFNNLNSLKLKQLMVNENSELENQSFSNFNKYFFYDILLTNLTRNSNSEIKKEKVNQKKILLTIFNQIKNNNSIKKINKKSYKTVLVSENFEKYLIKNFQQKIQDQLKRLENKRSKISKEGLTENQENTQLKTEYSRKENKILTTQKKLITKRIEFLTNLNDKLKAFESWYLTLPTDWKTNKIKLIENKQAMNASFDFQTSKKQYYFSKNFLNLLVDNCNNLIQYLDFKKESYLKTQNKIFNDLLQFELSDQNQITQKINNLNINDFSKNISQLTNNLIIQEFMKKPIKNIDNSNKVLQINKNNLKSQRSDKKLPLTINSSILKFLIKEQRVSNFDEILGSLLAIQKRGNSLSQKNIYYKNIKNQWNKKKFSTFSNLRKEENRLKNFMAIRHWTRSQPRFQKQKIFMDNKLLEYKGSLIKESKNSNSLEKKTTGHNLLTIDNFIKESILKPQRFEKQQSRKRLKFKKLPRQEYSKNLQAWENYLNQKEDVKNKQFFDDLSQSFQRWKNFGFFPQKIVFQKEILNSLTFLPFDSSNYNKKLTNFYEKNLQTITNLDIIKQIEYDRLIQKELNFFLNQNNLTSINLLNNKERLKLGDQDSKPLSFFYHNPIGNFDFFSETDSETNQNEMTYQNKDLINTLYEKFFVKSIQTPIDQSQINKKTLIGINTFPFYAGWDESLRKFVLTNRLLSRRDAGYQINTSVLYKEKENNFNIEFTQWPLQGRNAATTFFSHFPFINQPSDFSETIQYKNRTQFQQEEGISNIDLSKLENKNVGKNFSENNDVFKRIKRQKQELRNENRRNITNLVGSNEILNRRKAIFYPLKWKSIKSTTKKIILKSPLNDINNAFNYNKLQTIDQLSYSALSTLSDFKKADSSNFRSLISKFHLLMVLRKGNTGKIRLPKLRPYKKYIKKENDILESSWKTFLSKRKLRSYNFVRQKNIRTMHLYKAQLGEKLQWTKIQWLFRKNNSRANRQSENRKNKSGAHYLRPRKKSLRRRSLGIKYKKNQQIWSFNNFRKNYWNLGTKYDDGKTPMILTKKINKFFITDSSILNLSKPELNSRDITKQTKLGLYETPYNWIQPNNSSYIYNSLFKSPSLSTPALYSILPGHGRFIPKMQTMPLPKSSVQTIKRAIRLANFEPASFIQREVLSYEWSMKQLLQNMNKRLNHSVKRLVFKNQNNDLSETTNSKSSLSIDLLVQRHLRLFKKKLIQNPIISPSSNIYLSHFSRQRSFQKRSIRLRKFNMTLAMNLYDRWFFYYYTGGREDPLQNLFQIFENLTHTISTVNINEKNESNELNIRNNLVLKNNNLETDDKNLIFKSVRKFLTQKPDQKRSFNTFLTNLKTKKSSSISKTREILNEQQNSFNSQTMNNNSLTNENESGSNQKLDSIISQTQWWHLFNLFPQTIDGKLAQKEMLDKLSINKAQKKQQEKDLEEDRFYFLKANKSPIIQDFRSSKNVNRHYPLNGGFIWPGDYLRLQTIMLPKEKKYKYFYNKNLLFEIQTSTKQNDPDFQPSKFNVYSKSKIVDKINEFQNFVLEAK